MRHEGEASVEEILESIKKVIARDNRAGAIEERRRRSQAGITESAHTPAEAAPEPAYDDEAEDVLDLAGASYAQADDDDVFQDAEAAALDPEGDDTPLTGAAARASIGDNLAALAMLAEPGVAPRIVRSGETSLEELTRELLRPMLARWLDDNLPGMVERMVRDEIARIAGKRG